MMQRSKLRVWFGALMALSLVLAACGSDSSETTDAPEVVETTAPPETAAPETTVAETTPPTTEAAEALTLLVWADENRASVVEEVAPAFTEATGVEVQVELVDFGQIRDQVGVAGPAGEGPDVFIGASDWVGELATNGVLEPIDLGAREGDFTEASVNALTFNGVNYGVPHAVEAIALYYNTDYSPEAPATFDDMKAVCDANPDQTCLVVPGGGDGADPYHNYPFLSATGGYIFAQDGGVYDPTDVGLDSEGAIAGATFIEGLVTDGYLASTNYDDAKALFTSGDAIFWITGPWELGGAADWTVPWSVAPIPTIEGGTPKPFIGVQSFFLSSFSENKLVAQSFLLDFIATEEGQTLLYAADPRPPVHSAIIASVADDPVAAAFGLSAANGEPIPNIPEMSSVWGAWGDNMLLLRNGDITGAEAMAAAAEGVNTALGN